MKLKLTDQERAEVERGTRQYYGRMIRKTSSLSEKAKWREMEAAALAGLKKRYSGK